MTPFSITISNRRTGKKLITFEYRQGLRGGRTWVQSYRRQSHISHKVVQILDAMEVQLNTRSWPDAVCWVLAPHPGVITRFQVELHSIIGE